MVYAFGYLAFAIFITAYAAPSLVAIWTLHRRRPLVIALNVLLGWTIVGWLVALAMALERLPKRRRRKTERKLAPVAIPPEISHPSPPREHVDPPMVQDESYALWLDGGAAKMIGIEIARSADVVAI